MNIYGTPGTGGSTNGGASRMIGFRFTSSQNGTITALNFYIPPSSTDWGDLAPSIHRDSDQAQLATWQVITPSGTGAQTITLTDEVSISAGVSYAVSVYFATGTGRLYWEASQSYPVNNSPLSATTGAYEGGGPGDIRTYPTSDGAIWNGVDIEFTSTGGGIYVPFPSPYNKLIKAI
jgi:hypothetical protein